MKGKGYGLKQAAQQWNLKSILTTEDGKKIYAIVEKGENSQTLRWKKK